MRRPGRRMVGDRLLPWASTLNRRVFIISSVRRWRADGRLCAQTRRLLRLAVGVPLLCVPYLCLIAFSSSDIQCDSVHLFVLLLFLLRSNWPLYSVSGGREFRVEKKFSSIDFSLLKPMIRSVISFINNSGWGSSSPGGHVVVSSVHYSGNCLP